MSAQRSLEGMETPDNIEQISEAYIRNRITPDQSNALQALLDLGVLHRYSWLDLAMIYLDWEDDVGALKPEKDTRSPSETGESLSIPVFPFIPLAQLLESLERYPDFHIPLSHLFSPNIGRNTIATRVEEEDLTYVADTNIFRFRIAQELDQVEDGQYLPNADAYLRKWDRTIDWLKEQTKAALTEENPPEQSHGFQAFSFGKSVLVLRDAMRHYAQGDISSELLEKMGPRIAENGLSPREKYRLAISYAVFSMKFAIPGKDMKNHIELDPDEVSKLFRSLYSELCDAFFWDEDHISADILGQLAGGDDMETIKNLRMKHEGQLDEGFLLKIGYVEKLLDVGFDRELLVALLFLSENKWESIAKDARSWYKIIEHLEEYSDCDGISEMYAQKAEWIL